MTEQEIQRVRPNKRDREVLSKGKCRRRMPPVGFRRIFRPDESSFLERETWGEVIYVNYEHMCYTVKYNGSGLTETHTPVAGDAYKPADIKYNRWNRRGMSNERY